MLGYFAYGVEAVLVGLISVFVTSYAINRVLSIGEGSVAKSVQIGIKIAQLHVQHAQQNKRILWQRHITYLPQNGKEAEA